jgi:hypothetical protein
MPTTILASRYNTLRNQVNLVLGTSANVSPSYGYGQALSTSGVSGTQSAATPSSASKVTAKNYEDLYIDLIRTRSHQIGASLAISEFVLGDYNTNGATADKIELAYIQGLESLAASIATDRFSVHPTNLTVSSLTSASSSRPSSAWTSTIWSIFTVTFNTELERRHFFNAGGEIRLSASTNYTGSAAKSVDWQTILGLMGSTSFKATSTSNNAGVGTGSNIGNDDLTNAYQQVYSRDGGAVYANNEYRIFAKEYATGNSTSAMQFKVEFVDGSPTDPSWGVDEYVLGKFNSNIETATPSSQIAINGTVHNAVVINTIPVGALVRTLS